MLFRETIIDVAKELPPFNLSFRCNDFFFGGGEGNCTFALVRQESRVRQRRQRTSYYPILPYFPTYCQKTKEGKEGGHYKH